MKISTVKLQEMIVRSMKGVGNNKLLPITSLMNVRASDGNLFLTTTDGVNYMYISEPIDSVDEFDVTVNADKLSKLILKMTNDNIQLNIKESYLEIRGNGIYKIEIPVGDSGGAIEYPNPFESGEFTKLKKIGEISSGTIKEIINYIKPSLAVTMEIPCYTGYYMHDKVIATDTNKIACLDVKIFNQPRLISSEMMNMLSVMTDDIIKISANKEHILFSSSNCSVYGDLMDSIDEFQIDAINDLLENSFGSMCRVSKNALLQILDRLSIFVGVYDDNSIHVNFEDESMQLVSKSTDAYESLPYLSSDDVVPFDCYIDIQTLQNQVKAQEGDAVEIWFGEEGSIMIYDGDITKIIALKTE